MRDVGILETANDVNDGVGFADVLEELVAEALSLGGALDQPCYVNELNHGGHRALRLNNFREGIQPWVGDLDHADVRLDGAERVVRGFGFGGGQRVEQR